MNEQEINSIRQQLRQEISRPYQVIALDQQLNTEREPLQSQANINAPSNSSSRHFFSNNNPQFSSSLPNLNTGSLNQISSTRNSHHIWTTDDLVEAERFYGEVYPTNMGSNLPSPDSRGRNAPLPRRNSYLLESPETSPINSQVSQNIFLTNPNLDLSQTIDPGRIFLDQQNAERLSFEIPFIIAGEEVGSRLSPTNSNQTTQSNQSLEFPQTNSPIISSNLYISVRPPTPLPSPTPSSAPSPSNSSPGNSSSPVNSL
jgi:hypothetical protein